MHRACASLLLVAAGATSQSRLLVPSQYATLGAAVAAAQDGDTIVLAPGLHFVGDVRIDKSLTMLADGASLINGFGPTEPPLTLAIPAGKNFELRGGALGLFKALPLVLESCQGRVTILDLAPSTAAIRITDSPQVLIARSQVTGGYTAEVERSPTWPAITATNSTVALDRCTLRGPRADYERLRYSNRAGLCIDSDLRCVECVFRGGDASRTLTGPPDLPGAGAIRAHGGSLRMTGAATVVAAGTFAPDPDVVMTSGQLVLEPWMNPTTTLSGTVLLREVRPTVLATNVAAGQTASLLLQSPIGTFGILAVGFPGDRTIVPGFGGDVWLDPATLCVAAFGVQNGALGWTTLVPALWPLPVQFRWQGAVIDAGVATFTDPGAAVID